MVTFYFCFIFAANMYEQYLKYNSIPAGAVLRRILKKEKISQKQLSDKTGIITQRINDLINNKRRFTIETSAIISEILPVPHIGYFYLLQSHHDIYQYAKAQAHLPTELSSIRKTLFWDINIETLDWEKHKCWIIQRIFEYGNDDEVTAIIKLYGIQMVKDTLRSIQNEWRQTQREHMIKKHLQ